MPDRPLYVPLYLAVLAWCGWLVVGWAVGAAVVQGCAGARPPLVRKADAGEHQPPRLTTAARPAWEGGPLWLEMARVEGGRLYAHSKSGLVFVPDAPDGCTCERERPHPPAGSAGEVR